MDDKGNTLNFVQGAEKETPGNTIEERVAKRLAEATQKMIRWQSTLFRDDVLRVVPCDDLGKPIVKRRVMQPFKDADDMVENLEKE